MMHRMGGGMLNTTCTCTPTVGIVSETMASRSFNCSPSTTISTALSILAVSSVGWKSFSSSFNSLIVMFNGMGMAIRLPFSSSALKFIATAAMAGPNVALKIDALPLSQALFPKPKMNLSIACLNSNSCCNSITVIVCYSGLKLQLIFNPHFHPHSDMYK